MTKRLIISETEKNKIREMYGLLNEQVSNVQVGQCYQITNDKDKKIYKLKVVKVASNYVSGNLTDDKGVVYPGREVGLTDNKMSTMYDVEIPETETESASIRSIKVDGLYQKVKC